MTGQNPRWASFTETKVCDSQPNWLVKGKKMFVVNQSVTTDDGNDIEDISEVFCSRRCAQTRLGAIAEQADYGFPEMCAECGVPILECPTCGMDHHEGEV
jgi:hypothetical protein